ncbi:Membrane bound O-acyl transferase family protein [Prunus dulcis]|uniref:Membrane bound O-acyl transferase family protein n=1 Tax=Prunus dulcis TaxID=3755 RepID=A0A4Y1QWN0_PRUDU|nr:Membrane bound O-acyl transferase family protein [Prunus dulcis]
MEKKQSSSSSAMNLLNSSSGNKKRELGFLILYAAAFYAFIIHRSLQLSRDHYLKLFGLRPGWLLPHRLNDVSDAQWRNFQGNLPVLTVDKLSLKSERDVHYLDFDIFHIPIISAWSLIFARTKYFSFVFWIFNIFFLLCNLVLRMISFGYDYHWAHRDSRFDHKKHIQRCDICKSGKTCYQSLQMLKNPSIKFETPAFMLDVPQNNLSARDIAWYGLRWVFSLLLMELMTHLFYYNAFAISGMWKELHPMDVFIIGYGVLIFMWLKFFLIWRYFRFWSLICGIEVPENMPRCINNCYNLETFWKNWHASYNKWLVESTHGEFVVRELSAVAGAITITCLMVANLVGFVIGPSGISWLISQFLNREGLPVLAGMLLTFYVGTKLMFHIRDAKQSSS